MIQIFVKSPGLWPNYFLMEMLSYCYANFGIFGTDTWNWDPTPTNDGLNFFFKQEDQAMMFVLRWVK